jgi:hypothetical protein
MTIDLNRRKFVTLAGATLVLFVLSPELNAQGPAQPAATPTVNLTLEQRHTIKEFMKDVKVEPTTGNVALTIGDKVPEQVALQPIPAEIGQRVPQVKSHAFFIKDGRIVLVSTKDKTIADVIE